MYCYLITKDWIGSNNSHKPKELTDPIPECFTSSHLEEYNGGGCCCSNARKKIEWRGRFTLRFPNTLTYQSKEYYLFLCFFFRITAFVQQEFYKLFNEIVCDTCVHIVRHCALT